ncbi:MAG: 16S rRNA (uracil(1498)-N(3))-methyltransferase [Hamadaea sp.]|uniref:16S rRNA (uracil(1498)-N(3))-methyltransferase n=1 Tax=Hamadaea sp. TaxID=2024425 RepID=UPI0017981B1C|nr:16S rRNA (uracil(1498)-N(3))-methyltransferase [Hamadaea sp.]NUR70668.1 16S rRNA (uracil(1498)-N(3))-methyltransferase [Hamadaea sp.]NUT17855.1 16S rRNA (uracil(1498)-N(3))-methyltransferase [Hamadaea sp.]
MSKPLFLVDALPAAGRFVLEGAEGRHAADVQRLRPGEELLLGDGHGGVAPAVVSSVGKGTLLLDVGAAAVAEVAQPRIVVAQGLAKGDRGELAVQAMTEVGVDEILPWAAARSVTQWRGDRGAKSRDKWAATAREAAKQARRAWVPSVGGSPDVSTKQLAARISAGSAFVLHEEALVRLAAVDLPDTGDLILVVGPEGGVAPDELATFTEAGAIAVRLGDNVLRTSTAGVAAISLLNTRLGRW